MQQDEAQIAAALRQKIPQEVEPEPAKPTDPGKMGDAKVGLDLDTDELTMYKLHNFFGQTYSPTDTETINQAKFIYKRVAERIGNDEYGHVVSHIHELMRQVGVAKADNRIYRLYQWLKLDGMRQGVVAEMQSLGVE